MICLKSLQRLCCQLTKCAIFIIIIAFTAAIYSLVSNHLFLTVVITPDNKEGGLDLLSLSKDVSGQVNNMLVSDDKNAVNRDKRSVDQHHTGDFIKVDDVVSAFKNGTMQMSKTKNDVVKVNRKLNNKDEALNSETDADMLKRYNVTPNASWLKTFYKTDFQEKRKSLFDFPFIIDGRDICAESRDPFLVMMVLSVHTHIDTRDAIRNTWGRAANPGVWPKIGTLQNNVKLIFLFGRGNTALKNAIVKEESDNQKDIVQADFEDSYFNLSYKVITGIRWVSEFCPGAKYILKADEDVFVHVHNLIKALTELKATERDMFVGHTNENSKVQRSGRWAVTPSAFPFPTYPIYNVGNTYVIPGSRAGELYKTAGYLDYMNIEDVFVTGILRTLIDADIKDVAGFTFWYEKKPKPCEFKNTVRISATKVTESLQYDIWEGLKSNVRNCYKVTKKISNIKRPEYTVKYKPVIRDEHIYYNKTSKQFYSVG